MDIYEENGYADRYDYLKDLAESFGVPLKKVNFIADMLGESEDFDALVSALEDAGDWL